MSNRKNIGHTGMNMSMDMSLNISPNISMSMSPNRMKPTSRTTLITLLLTCLFVLTGTLLKAQVNPPRPINLTASSVQNLSFGAFAITGTNGGTITVSNTGIRTSTGDIFLTGNDYSYGIFTVESIEGTTLLLMNGPSYMLTGSNGGNMTITLGETMPPLPYLNTSTTTVFQIGATLHVGPMQDNPPGDYNGVYEIIINHE